MAQLSQELPQTEPVTQLSDRELLVQALRRSETHLLLKIQTIEAEKQTIDDQLKQAIASLHGVQFALRYEGEVVEPQFQIINTPALNGSTGLVHS